MKLSVVSTLYKSESYLPEFLRRVKSSINRLGIKEYEIILVNDASPDESIAKVLQIKEEIGNIIILDLSMNYGHHKAIMCGLNHAKGDYVFLIDCDLEEDPELLEQFWLEMENHPSYDVVYGVQHKRKGGLMERYAGSLFYKLLNRLSDIEYPKNTLTARLMKLSYVETVTKYKEVSLEIWGVFVLSGFNQVGIKVNKGNKGSTTYNFKRKFLMAIETITAFSSKPLYMIFFLGLIMTFISFCYLVYVVVLAIIYKETKIEGWSSIMASIWFVGGLTIFLLGVIAIYLSKIFLEVKNRPLYNIKKTYP